MGQKIGLIIAFVSTILFIGIIVFSLIQKFLYKNEYKKKCKNQIKLKKEKKLPFYYLSKYNYFLLCLFVVSIIVCILIWMISKNFLYILLALPMFMIIFMLVLFIYLINYNSYEDINFIKKEIAKNYEIIDKPISSNAMWLSEKEYFQKPSKKNMHNFSYLNGNNYINIGAVTFSYKMPGRHRISFIDLFNLYVEIELPKRIDYDIYILNKTNYNNINENNSIIPNYATINPILFEKSTKENIEKIMNDEIQKLIAELATKLKKYSIIISDNKITLVVHNACLSTLLSRTFTKKKCLRNCMYSLKEIIEKIEKISQLIVKNNENI